MGKRKPLGSLNVNLGSLAVESAFFTFPLHFVLKVLLKCYPHYLIQCLKPIQEVTEEELKLKEAK